MNQIAKTFKKSKAVLVAALLTIVLVPGLAHAAQTSDSVGIEAKINSPAPTTPATISIPNNGQTFNSTPITVSGLCNEGLLVKLFKNNVFSGSAQCAGGNFSITTDLFKGQNDLIAKVFDALDQAGPDSNTVTITFNDQSTGVESRPLLTSNFAKKGANPGDDITWPIGISGGEGPYAISVDWGDGDAPDLISREFGGNFDIVHSYSGAGTYVIIVKASDSNGSVAYLQLTGVANGPLSQENASTTEENDQPTKTKVVWQPAAIAIPFIISTFWLGKRYETHLIRKKLERGDRPF